MSQEIDVWRISETAHYIESHGYRVVTTQFPDDLLADAISVTTRLCDACSQIGHAIDAYVLADTTYNSLSVDEVAAAHVNADCIVHYGRASLTPLSRTPAYYVFPTSRLDVERMTAAVHESGFLAPCNLPSPVIVLLDQIYLDALQELRTALEQLADTSNDTSSCSFKRKLIFAKMADRSAKPVASCLNKQELEATPAAACGGGDDSIDQTAPPRGSCMSCGGPRGGECMRTEDSGGRGSLLLRSDQRCVATSAGTTAAPTPTPAQDAIGDARCESDGFSASPAGFVEMAGYKWRTDATTCANNGDDDQNDPRGERPRFLWIGANDAPALQQLQLSYSLADWCMHDPFTGQTQLGLGEDVKRVLRRRYFLVEKTRNANVIGILVGTLGAAGYGDAVQRLRSAAHAAGKRTYTLLMGKPSPAKLANFPEIEVFVLVADPQGQILDCKEYLSPIVTPHEAMLAFDPDATWEESAYRLDFQGILDLAGRSRSTAAAAGAAVTPPLPSSQRINTRAPRFSLVDGTHHVATQDGGTNDDGDHGPHERGDGSQRESSGSMALVEHAKKALQLTPPNPAGSSRVIEHRSAADYLVHKRTWTGVDAPLVGAAAKQAGAAVPGQRGRAAGYEQESANERVE